MSAEEWADGGDFKERGRNRWEEGERVQINQEKMAIKGEELIIEEEQEKSNDEEAREDIENTDQTDILGEIMTGMTKTFQKNKMSRLDIAKQRLKRSSAWNMAEV